MFQAFFSPTLFSELYSSRPSFKSFLAFSFTCGARVDSGWGQRGDQEATPSPGHPGQPRVLAPPTHGGGLLGATGDPRESRVFQEEAGTLRGGDSTSPPTAPLLPGHAPSQATLPPGPRHPMPHTGPAGTHPGNCRAQSRRLECEATPR